MAALAFGACGDSTGVTGDQLSEAEAAQLATAVLAAAMATTESGQGPAMAEGPQAAPISMSYQVDFEAECELGGSVSVEASLEFEGDSEVEGGRIEYNMRQVHEGCVVTSEEGIVFTLDGAPDVEGTVVIESDGLGSLVIVGNLEGRVEWATEGRSGACPMVLAFGGEASEVEETGAFAVEGSICGVDIDYSASVG